MDTTISVKELEEKVIRKYKEGMSLAQLSNFGICGLKMAGEIINRAGIMRKRHEFRPFDHKRIRGLDKKE